LRVDLTSGRITHEPTSRYEAYVGAAGIEARIYTESVASSVEPFDPENR
jgi:aldehyde:ferredoxin oxidoreductase